jgi:hypothetical protein
MLSARLKAVSSASTLSGRSAVGTRIRRIGYPVVLQCRGMMLLFSDAMKYGKRVRGNGADISMQESLL